MFNFKKKKFGVMNKIKIHLKNYVDRVRRLEKYKLEYNITKSKMIDNILWNVPDGTYNIVDLINDFNDNREAYNKEKFWWMTGI